MDNYYIKFRTAFDDNYLLKIGLESAEDALILQEVLYSDYGSFCGRGVVMTEEEVCVLEE